jgi:multidrug efflux pump subunit AcrA (membrane-fusion protein)
MDAERDRRTTESDTPAPPRRLRALGFGLTVAAVLAVGLASGWLAASQKAEAPGGHAHGESEGGSAGVARLDPRTLKNLGVVVEEARPRDFAESREVPGEIALPPGAVRPVHAPVAGRVVRVLVAPGRKVAAGEPVAEVLRDPFPRPTLSLTDPVLKATTEHYHALVGDLRAARQALDIAREELARVRAALASGTPSKVEIDLAYDERRAQRRLETLRIEAGAHGLADEEVSAIEAGGPTPPLPLPRRVLHDYHLWPPEAEAVLALLPPEARESPYAQAVVAELAGGGALTEELRRALSDCPRCAGSFLEVAGLLQAGLTVPALRALDAAGGLEATVPVRAPEGAPDWDLSALLVQPGARVESGDAVAEVTDARRVLVVLRPAGRDLPAVAGALESGAAVVGIPLVPGSGPVIPPTPLARFEAGEEGDPHGRAVVEVENPVLAESDGPDGRRQRSWRLRPGLRYLVLVPQEVYRDAFVLPADAVVLRGADRIAMVELGNGFRRVPVTLLHEDAQHAVVANDGAIFPGDKVVVRGAFALSLALEAAAGGGAAADHGHAH